MASSSIALSWAPESLDLDLMVEAFNYRRRSLPTKKTWAAAKLWWTVGQARQWPSYNICKISNSKSLHHVSSCSEKLMFRELVQISLKHTRRNMIAPLLKPWKTTTGLNVTETHYCLVLMLRICRVFCHVSSIYHSKRSMPGFNVLISVLQVLWEIFFY